MLSSPNFHLVKADDELLLRQAFTHALYNLATYTQYIAPLREEIESVVSREGWSKASIGKMRKLDSFFKESMRLADGALRESPSRSLH